MNILSRKVRLPASLQPVALACLLLSPIASAARADYVIQRVLTGLNQPTFVTQAPGDSNSLYFVERRDSNNFNVLGKIRKFDQTTGALSTFLDVSGSVTEDGGLISVTFHPDFQTNGLFYVMSCRTRTNALEEYKVVGGTPQLQRTLIEYTNPVHAWHTINQAHFRPGGNSNELYVLTGDGGTQASEAGFNAPLIESPDSIFGKVLKVDLNASFPTPAGDATHPGIDVVALGIRNPFRSSFDRSTGDMYFGDVGFSRVEEIDFIPASQFTTPAATPLDFGWTSREGTLATNPSPPGGPKGPNDIDPIFDYTHSGSFPTRPSPLNGLAVIGGYVYRGPVPELQGRYFFAEHIQGTVFSGTFDTSTNPTAFNGQNLTNVVNHTVSFETTPLSGNLFDPSFNVQDYNIQFITSYGEDLAGNLYMTKIGTSTNAPLGQGEIFRIVPATIKAEVDRDSGQIKLTNISSEAIPFSSLSIASRFGAIDPTMLKPITGNYDTGGNSEVDNNNAWNIISPAGSQTAFREASLGDAGALDPGEEIILSLSGGWIRSYREDLLVGVLLQNGIANNAIVKFTGHGDVPFLRSDFDFDDDLDEADWTIYKANHEHNLSAFSLAEAYALGDLNADGKNDFADFKLFQADYIAKNGAAAFAALNAQIPEPEAFFLAIVCACISNLGILRVRIRRR